MSNPIGRAWSGYRRLNGVSGELALLGLMLAFSLFVLPVLIWFAGKFFLGEYVRNPSGAPTGGPLALWVDYLRGLASGSLGYWTVLLGPYLLVLALRVSGRLIKR
ncbi:MAG: hypothetical protein ABI616_02430 [Pseudomonadota bacterium]